jgi:Flp pilus assembly protein TadG
MRRLRTFWADSAAAAAAEFALVLPVALLFLLGIIDVGRYIWEINQLEKAVQIGTRYAVATGVVSLDLNTMDFTDFDCNADPDNPAPVKPGDNICKDALGKITCSQASGAVSCTCTDSVLGAGTCPGSLSNVDDAAFTSIVTRMRTIAPQIGADDVRISYSGSGIGYAGDPHKDEEGEPLSQVSPVVTVQVLNQQLRAISLLGWGMELPSFQYSQTLEDGEGAIAY